jgi:hypothetical protein
MTASTIGRGTSAVPATPASARIIRMNHSHKISAYPIRTSIRTRTRARMWHPPQSDAWGFAGNCCCDSAVKWDEA